MTILPEKYDLTDREFGFWTVLRLDAERSSPTRPSTSFWICRCHCGVEKSVSGQNLAKGGSNSCGCETHRKQDTPEQKFGRLTLIERVQPVVRQGTKWLCLCDCGKEKAVDLKSMKAGKTVSCGCYRKSGHAKTHGESDTRLYQTWAGMRDRCSNTNSRAYSDYGGRGISVCEEWRTSFEVFSVWAKNNGYADRLTIERLDVNGNYCPENCTFITLQAQARNRRNTVWLTVWGERKTIFDWAADNRIGEGVTESTIRTRHKRGWDAEKAVSTPVKGYKRLAPGNPGTLTAETSIKFDTECLIT